MTADDRKDYRSLGEILRDAREAQDKSIEDVSDITKISPKVLMALEADDLDRVADPVYAKSFVRTLAEAFDLDARWLLTKLEHASAAQKPDPVTPEGEERRDDTTWHIEDVRIQKVETPKPKSFPRLAVGMIVGVLLAVVGFWLIQRNSGSSDAASESSLSPAPTRQADLTTTQPPLILAEEPTPAGEATTAIENEPGPTQPQAQAADPAPARPEPVPSQTQTSPEVVREADPDPKDDEEPTATTQATPDADEPAAAARERIEEDTAPAKTDPVPETAKPEPEEEIVVAEEGTGLPSIVRPPDEAAQPVMKLVVTAVEKVDVVVAADGRGRRMRTLNEGESWTVEGHDHFSLEISDPQRVHVELDGIHRDPPPGLSGEWILYPNPSPH